MKSRNMNPSSEYLKREALIEETRAKDRARLEEEIRREATLLAPDGDMDVTDPDQQAGRSFHRSVIIRRLKKLNPGLVYERSLRKPTQGGIYFDGYRGDRLTGQLEYGHWFICGIPHETVREFDLRIVVSDGVPDPTISLHTQRILKLDSRERGWRSVLLELVKSGLIELDKAVQAFSINDGRSSEKWMEATR